MGATADVGKGLVALCKQGKFLDAIERYYADDVVSVEGAPMPGMGQQMEGIEAIKGKNRWWADNHEVHGLGVEGPFVVEGTDQFAVVFHLDVTPKATGERNQGSEVGLYTVKDGKVAREQFFYQAG